MTSSGSRRPSPVLVRLRSRPSASRPLPARSAGGNPCACVGDRSRYDPPVSDAPDRGSRVPPAERLAEVMEARANAPTNGRRQGTARARSGRPCRLPRDRRHTDAHARPAASPPLRTGQPLEAVARGRDGPVRVRGTKRAKGRGDRARLGGHQLRRREPTDEAGKPAAAPGPRTWPGVPEGRHVPMPTSTSFPSGHSAVGVRVRRGRGRVDAGVRRTVARSGRDDRLLARHTGVHYPGDVIIGSVIGATIGQTTALAASRRFDER